jgi:phosphotransferase system enzyme I (PtsI)
MQVATGISILNGIAIGKIRIFKAPEYKISEDLVDDPIPELNRFEKARLKVQEQQHVLYEKAVASAGEDSAAIFEFHADMLDDDDLLDAVKSIIVDQKHTAEYAARQGFGNMAQMFKEMDDPYFQARSADVIDVGNAVVECLLGIDTTSLQGTEPSILVAEDLAPSQTVKLDKSLLLGMITREGSSNSHTAILARSMNLPALIQCKGIEDSWDGKLAILDGYNSCVYVEPTPDLLASLTAKQQEDRRAEALLQELKGKKNTTIDGKTIKVYANIGGPSDVGAVQANDAEGVGLFRSEFVYLNAREDPSEEEQFQAYKRVLETLAPKQVIIRTCDIGADKTIDYMHLDKEANPALGYRAIRICLTRKDFFKRQLRALLRASAYGNLGIMFPMIISLREVRECKEILAECRRELANEGVKVSDQIQVGIMVETPAAALCADELAQEVDFFSLGTNDLTQYTLAIDRQNAKLEPFLDTHHPAILREIQMTIEAGHRHGCWVGICGELGADPTLTETFLRMGVDELSVNAKSVLPLRKKIRSIDLSKPVSADTQSAAPKA